MYNWEEINAPLKPFAHQYDMIRKLVENFYHALYCEMGTGKTKSVIDAYRLRSQVENVVMLVLCPKSVIHSWTSDLTENDTHMFTVIDASLTKNKKIEAFGGMARAGRGVIIMNYEQLLSLQDVPYDLIDWVVLDESHRIKNPQAKTTQRVLSLFRDTKYRTLMTGTAIGNHPTDIWSQARFLNPKLFHGINFYAFRNRYCYMGGFQNGQIVGYKNEPELKMRIAEFSTQLKKQDCIDLPDKIYMPRVMEMPKELKQQYDSMKNELILELEDVQLTAEVAATKIMRLSQITSGAFLKGKNPKIEELRELIAEVIENKKQMVIMHVFKESGRMIAKLIEEMGIPFSRVNGETSDRPDQIKNFQSSKNKIFLGQVTACKEGVTLTKGSFMVYYENNYSLTDRVQSEDRIHRIGQVDKCTYIDLCYGGTVDVAVHKAIKRKQDIATFLVDSFKKGGADFKKAKKKTQSFS